MLKNQSYSAYVWIIKKSNIKDKGKAKPDKKFYANWYSLNAIL